VTPRSLQTSGECTLHTTTSTPRLVPVSPRQGRTVQCRNRSKGGIPRRSTPRLRTRRLRHDSRLGPGPRCAHAAFSGEETGEGPRSGRLKTSQQDRRCGSPTDFLYLGIFPRALQTLSAHDRPMEIIVDIDADAAGRLSGNVLSPEHQESHAFSGTMEFLACIELLCRRGADVSVDPHRNDRNQPTQ
jgi:hypothetical protein